MLSKNILFMVDATSTKVSIPAFVVDERSKFAVHRRITNSIELPDPTHYSMTHIKSGLGCSKIAPEWCEGRSSLLRFSRWLEINASKEVEALDILPYHNHPATLAVIERLRVVGNSYMRES